MRRYIKDKLASLTLPKTTIYFMVSGGEWALSIKIEACELFGMPIELAMFIQKGGGVKGWALYLGFKIEKDKRSSKKDSSQKAADTIKKIMGDPIRRLGFAMASKSIRTVRSGSKLNFYGTAFQARLPFIVDEIWPGPQIYTEADLSIPRQGFSFVGMFGSLTENMAGDSDPSGSSLGSTIARKCTPERKKRSVFVIPISKAPEICLGMDFRPEDGGIPIGPAVRFTGLVIQGCVKILPFKVTLSLEVAADIKLPVDLDTPLAEKSITMTAMMGMDVMMTTKLITLDAFFAARLKSANQVWHNPFGILAKMGLVFPLGAGIGLSINLQTGVPIPTYFEIEAGFIGCASKIYSTDDDDDGDGASGNSTLTAQAALGRQNADHSSQMIPFGPQRDINDNAITAPKPGAGGPRKDVNGNAIATTAANLGEGGGGSSAIPGLESIYCGVDEDGDEDPYGRAVPVEAC